MCFSGARCRCGAFLGAGGDNCCDYARWRRFGRVWGTIGYVERVKRALDSSSEEAARHVAWVLAGGAPGRARALRSLGVPTD